MTGLIIHGELEGAPTAERVAELLDAVTQAESATLPEVTVSFVEPDDIAALNHTHRNKNTPTDVLSFPFDDSFPHGAGGELVVAPKVCQHNAEARGRPLADELDEIIVHGLLHLLGYEDESDAGRDHMEKRTHAILDTLGVSHG